MTVCTGNICRSPMAEVVLRHRLDEAGLGEDVVVVDSTGVSDEEEGNPMDRRARRVLLDAGYDVPDGGAQAHRARQVQPGQVEQRDLVLAMTAAHRRSLQRIAPSASDRVALWRSFDPAASGLVGAGLDVPDPWYGDQRDFEVCLEQVEAAADGVVEHVRAALAHRV
ncbi:low molecular weight protein-tyrosine-phosphatase [Quadrisphaera oryzae]|uniref:low molecular weight protein-tyrosine-phosphatase n=1 Tax=Quadrisphaera TaxID=317661 RepID=UPI001648579E|nr:low molecular weight protein-tyrosine-phosphatase [Quadrisphaera sp. RL12-1S]MBC3760987.1 low molecular weight phosphotyrosine protein phosphatase [Quadrisphaera sp. RL12-1S]